MKAFVDTSAWFAAVFKRDRNNSEAKRLLLANPLLTTNYVAIETWMLIANRLNREAADRFLANLLVGSTEIVVGDLDDLKAAELIRLDFPDQNFSPIDRTSFVVMERLGISRVVSFDNDFVIYRYGPARERAFEVLR